MKTTTCGIDLAKNVFAIHPVNSCSGDNTERTSREYRRGALLAQREV